MKGTQVQTTVRVPLAELVKEIALAHSIASPFISIQVEGNSLVLAFGSKGPSQTTTGKDDPAFTPAEGEPKPTAPGASPVSVSASDAERAPHPGRKQRRTGKRNRMRTRGWNVVTKTKNSHGQTVTIYEPFVKALEGKAGPRREKEKAVAEILRANGNRPGPDSVRYYLENTLEYLSNGAKT